MATGRAEYLALFNHHYCSSPCAYVCKHAILLFVYFHFNGILSVSISAEYSGRIPMGSICACYWVTKILLFRHRNVIHYLCYAHKHKRIVWSMKLCLYGSSSDDDRKWENMQAKRIWGTRICGWIHNNHTCIMWINHIVKNYKLCNILWIELVCYVT